MYRITKRLIDILFSLFGLFLFLPFFMIISLLIVVESKGGVFFIQDRIGKDGKPFRMVKFRTMCKDAHLKGNAITAKNDFRITRIGNFLRDYKIDELPNLINVFLGQMSIVGPRPEVPDYKSEFSGEMEELLEIKPGITGPSQLFYFYEFNIVPTKNVTPEFYKYHLKNKMRLDLDYKRNRTILSDLKLIFLTVLRMFFKEDGLNKREKAEVNEGEDTGEDDKVYSKVKTRSHLTA